MLRLVIKFYLTLMQSYRIILKKCSSQVSKIMKNDKIFKLLILIGLCGYAVVFAFVALMHTHEHHVCSDSVEDCTACFYDVHHIAEAIPLVASVVRECWIAIQPGYDAIFLSVNLSYSALSRAPPSPPIYQKADVGLV